MGGTGEFQRTFYEFTKLLECTEKYASFESVSYPVFVSCADHSGDDAE